MNTNESLLDAARNGHTECARLLIDAGADANAKDEDGWTSPDMGRQLPAH